jgi:hypothetical protein
MAGPQIAQIAQIANIAKIAKIVTAPSWYSRSAGTRPTPRRSSTANRPPVQSLMMVDDLGFLCAAERAQSPIEARMVGWMVSPPSRFDVASDLASDERAAVGHEARRYTHFAEAHHGRAVPNQFREPQ